MFEIPAQHVFWISLPLGILALPLHKYKSTSSSHYPTIASEKCSRSLTEFIPSSTCGAFSLCIRLSVFVCVFVSVHTVHSRSNVGFWPLPNRNSPQPLHLHELHVVDDDADSDDGFRWWSTLTVGGEVKACWCPYTSPHNAGAPADENSSPAWGQGLLHRQASWRCPCGTGTEIVNGTTPDPRAARVFLFIGGDGGGLELCTPCAHCEAAMKIYKWATGARTSCWC